MHLLDSPQATHVILEPSPGRREGIAHRHEHVLVGMVYVMVVVDDDLATRHADIDTNGIKPPLAMVSVGLGDDDVAPRDPVVKGLEMFDVLECRVADGLVDRDVVERDLSLRLHGGLLRRFLKPET